MKKDRNASRNLSKKTAGVVHMGVVENRSWKFSIRRRKKKRRKTVTDAGN